MKTLRDMATLTADVVRYEGGQFIVDFTLRGAKVLRPKDAEKATAAMVDQFKTLLAMNGCKHYAWPPTVDVVPHSDFVGFKGRVSTLAQQPSIGAAIMNGL